MARNISVDLDTNKKNTVIAQCKQGDDLLLNVNVFEGGLKKNLTNSTIIIKAGKPNGTFVIQNTGITKNDNKIIAELVRDFTRVAGTTEIELTLIEGDKQNTTFDIKLIVDESVISQKAEDKSMTSLLEDLQTKIIEAGRIKTETEDLISTGGAIDRGEFAEVKDEMVDARGTFQFLVDRLDNIDLQLEQIINQLSPT